MTFKVLSGVQAGLRCPGHVSAWPGRSYALSVPTKTIRVNGLDCIFTVGTMGIMAKKKAKPIGRPPKGPEASRSHYLQVRVQEVERDSFAAAAELSGLDVSSWVRTTLRAAARKELTTHG